MCKYIPERYTQAELYAPENFWITLKENPLALEEICNGVGSRLSWTYHLTPDTIWLLDVSPAADIHDWMYTFPVVFPYEENGEMFWTGEEYRAHSDRVFLNNMYRLFNLADSRSWISRRVRPFRNTRALSYYTILRNCGGPSFWSDKNKPEILGQLLNTNKIKDAV
ncbi:MAG: hypothetical protein WC373_01785 [Smithella sp.]|jgi:hypothetical protein